MRSAHPKTAASSSKLPLARLQNHDFTHRPFHLHALHLSVHAQPTPSYSHVRDKKSNAIPACQHAQHLLMIGTYAFSTHHESSHRQTGVPAQSGLVQQKSPSKVVFDDQARVHSLTHSNGRMPTSCEQAIAYETP